MQTAPLPDQADKARILGDAVINAGASLGLSATEVGRIIGRSRTTIVRNGVDPDTPSGQLALLLIRLYRGLYALLGGDEAAMKHWMRSPITTLRGTPVQRIHDVTGLVHAVEYLDAIRGKV